MKIKVDGRSYKERLKAAIDIACDQIKRDALGIITSGDGRVCRVDITMSFSPDEVTTIRYDRQDYTEPILVGVNERFYGHSAAESAGYMRQEP